MMKFKPGKLPLTVVMITLNEAHNLLTASSNLMVGPQKFVY